MMPYEVFYDFRSYSVVKRRLRRVHLAIESSHLESPSTSIQFAISMASNMGLRHMLRCTCFVYIFCRWGQ